MEDAVRRRAGRVRVVNVRAARGEAVGGREQVATPPRDTRLGLMRRHSGDALPAEVRRAYLVFVEAKPREGVCGPELERACGARERELGTAPVRAAGVPEIPAAATSGALERNELVAHARHVQRQIVLNAADEQSFHATLVRYGRLRLELAIEPGTAVRLVHQLGRRRR